MSYIRVNNGFLGYRPSNTTRFCGSDSLYNLNDSLQKMPNDWYYKDVEITYNNNSLGHRCNHVESINLDNYVLFVGCSHTVGVGNRIEDCFPYQVAQSLNMDYYTLAIGGTGSDVMFHNLSLWLATIAKRPKFIVWQWSGPVRYITMKGHNIFGSCGVWNNSKESEDFIIAGEVVNFFNTRIAMVSAFLKNIQIPLIEVSFMPDTPNAIFYEGLDYARDHQHYGVLSNKKLAEILTSTIQSYK